MRIYCMSDIHGCIAEFVDALALVWDHLDEPDTMLCLLGDYIHGGADGYAVLDKIMNLQKKYGPDKVVALMGGEGDAASAGSAMYDDFLNEVNKAGDSGDAEGN